MTPVDIGLPREESPLDKLERLANEFPENQTVVESAVVPFGSPEYWLRILDGTGWRPVSYDTLPQATKQGTVLQQLCHLERRVPWADVKPNLLAIIERVRAAELEAKFGPGNMTDAQRQAALASALEQIKAGA